MGKTAFMVNMSNNAAKVGRKTGIFSLEQSKSQLADRIIAKESQVNSMKFRSGRFAKEDWSKIVDAASEIDTWNIQIDDVSGVHYNEICRRARKMVKEHGTEIFFIDYLSFIIGDNPNNKDKELGSITRALKSLAKELKVPVILLCQLNRGLEARTNKRPKLSDLRDSGNIEQDADLVVFVYRDAMYNKKEDNPAKNIAEIDIAKHRNGPTGMVELLFFKTRMEFANSMQ